MPAPKARSLSGADLQGERVLRVGAPQHAWARFRTKALAAFRLPLAALGVLAVVLFPDGALACPGCIAGTEENRVAFLVTTGLLSFLPLMMIGGVIYWLRKRARRLEEEAAHA